MPGQVNYTNDPSLYDLDPVAISVWGFDPTQPPDQAFSAYPNITCLAIEWGRGPQPSLARFRYEFNDVFPELGDPLFIEDVLPLDATGQGVVNADQRLCVRVLNPDGTYSPIWDGFAQVPQANADNGEVVTFTGLWTPIRIRDRPIGGAYYRNGSLPQFGAEAETDLRVRFNPEGKGNRTPFGYDHGSVLRDIADEESIYTFPCFLDERLKSTGDVLWPVHWHLGQAARYAMFHWLLKPNWNLTQWVQFSDPSIYDGILDSREPVPKDTGVIDLADPDSYTDKPIRVQDLDVSDDPWDIALGKIINPDGFDFTFDLSEDSNGFPVWTLVIYRTDTGGPQKKLKLQPAAAPGMIAPLDPTMTNLAGMTIQRDGERLWNHMVVQGSNTRYEMSVVLAPGFTIDPTDNQPANLHQWRIGDPNFDPVKYRVYVADECGEGFWDFASGTWVTLQSLDLDGLIGVNPVTQEPLYAVRRRPCEGSLLTKDFDGTRRKAEVWVSADYMGTKPGIWDGTGTWQQITMGGWETLDDRLGIRLTRPDLENYVISKQLLAVQPGAFVSGAMRVVTCMANPNVAPETTTPRFWFRQTCVIHGDRGIKATAERRAVSPSKYSVERRLDFRGWFHSQVRDKSSPYTTVAGQTDILVLDSAEAQAQADAMRRAHEVGDMAGTFPLNYFSRAYKVGDQITEIDGREISLRQNLGAATDESPVYPIIIGITWNFDQCQKTIIAVNDHRADPAPERRR